MYNLPRFEPVSRFAGADLPIPSRATTQSAGYDFSVAEDIVVPRFEDYSSSLLNCYGNKDIHTVLDAMCKPVTLDLEQMAAITKKSGCKPTLVSTGMRCFLPPDKYLELTLRSSTPLKYWLIMANGIGIIDADYSNADNEGEIFLQLINLSPFDIQLRKGDKIAQGIIKSYNLTINDITKGERTGGFGSTTEPPNYD